jgi:hypothetical protein
MQYDTAVCCGGKTSPRFSSTLAPGYGIVLKKTSSIVTVSTKLRRVRGWCP